MDYNDCKDYEDCMSLCCMDYTDYNDFRLRLIRLRKGGGQGGPGE